jgi:hypothetical protein
MLATRHWSGASKRDLLGSEGKPPRAMSQSSEKIDRNGEGILRPVWAESASREARNECWTPLGLTPLVKIGEGQVWNTKGITQPAL